MAAGDASLTTVGPRWFLPLQPSSCQPSPPFINQFSTDKKFIWLFKIGMLFFFFLGFFSLPVVLRSGVNWHGDGGRNEKRADIPGKNKERKKPEE